jgi:UTP--glucose-1-phosphate uridylyltransferase
VLVTKVTKAVIPAAGLGTRFLPVTKSMPKEMLPIIDKPVIHFVVEEAIASGIDDIIIITGRGKRAIEDYFDASPELEMYLREDQRHTLLQQLEEISSLCDIHYIRQKEPRGLGDAILKAEKHVGENPFAVLLGDDIILHEETCTSQLKRIFERFNAPVISVENVPREKVSNYGIIQGIPAGENIYRVADIVEKPSRDTAPSTLGAVGRYIFTREIFGCLRKTSPGIGGEIQLTDAIKLLLKDSPVYACCFKGKRYDAGDKMGYIETIIDFALQSHQMRDPMMKFLQEKMKRG